MLFFQLFKCILLFLVQNSKLYQIENFVSRHKFTCSFRKQTFSIGKQPKNAHFALSFSQFLNATLFVIVFDWFEEFSLKL